MRKPAEATLFGTSPIITTSDVVTSGAAAFGAEHCGEPQVTAVYLGTSAVASVAPTRSSLAQ